jgi:PHD/YefM family antitoxin component YafN of YafNO toxin-antitoxin module
METVTIPKEEYEALKKEAEIDLELVEKIKRSLDDVKLGRITEWNPK